MVAYRAAPFAAKKSYMYIQIYTKNVKKTYSTVWQDDVF